MESSAILDAALDYGRRGWKVLPLHNLVSGGCSCNLGTNCPERNRGKHPRLNEWQRIATDDESQIVEWWRRWPIANIGVLLGKASNLVDVECDTPESEKALVELFDGDFPFVPTYQASRGKHRLFFWSDSLPYQDKAVFKWKGVEFRIGGGSRGAQSVFPPSMHPSGKRYQWIASPDDAELAPIPERVIKKLSGEVVPPLLAHHEKKAVFQANGVDDLSIRWKAYFQDEVLETIDGRDNVIYAEAVAMWGEQVRLNGGACLDEPRIQAVVFKRLWGLNLAVCRPTLDQKTVQVKCESARKFMLGKQSDGKAMTSLTALGLEYRDDEFWPGEWRLEVVNSDPKIARLFAPFLPKEVVEMTIGQFDEPKSVHQAIFAETGTVCLADRPGFWSSIWNGSVDKEAKKSRRGLKAKLIESAKIIDAPSEVKRPSIIAQMLLRHLERPKVVEEGQYPDSTRPSLLEEGTILFFFEKALEPMTMTPDKFKRNELSKLLEEVGSMDRQLKVSGGKPKRFKSLDRKALRRLEQIAGERLSSAEERPGATVGATEINKETVCT